MPPSGGFFIHGYESMKFQLGPQAYDAGVALTGLVYDSTGAYLLHPDSLAQVLTYNGPSGAVDTITVGPDLLGNSYKQTFAYTGSNITAISAWVKQ